MTGDQLHMVPDLGKTLAGLRKSAGRSQAEISKSLKVDASRVSRIETGDFSPSATEIDAYLEAVGTPEAQEFRKFMRQKFEILPKPEFRHPERHALCKAENYLQKLKRFTAEPEIPGPLLSQASMYQESLLRFARYLADLNHSIAYIGDIGVGKTTFVCMQTGLVLPEHDKTGLEKIVLEFGRGGTTVCEVRIQHSLNYGLMIDPLPDAEVYRLADDFCAGLWSDGNVEGDEEKQEKGVAREINRALRNMTELSRQRRKDAAGKMTRIDPAVELARRFANLGDFRAEVSSRLKLWQRKKKEIWYDPKSKEPALFWLKKIFSEINNGRNPDFSLPLRISVFAPSDALRSSSYSLEVIDTKGVDRTAIRPDLKSCVDDPRTLTVLCSRFTQAPDLSVQGFLEHLNDIGADRALRERVALLILVHDTEALGMKDDSGEMAETEEEGYDLKRDHIEGELQRFGLNEIPLHFYNAKTEAPASITNVLIGQLGAMRGAQVARISEVARAIDQLFRNRETQHALAAQREVNESLRVFVSQNGKLPGRKRFAHQAVLAAVHSLHPSSVWATTRRAGSWGNLDVYYYLGSGAEADVKLRVEQTFGELEGIVRNMLGKDDLEPAHKFLTEFLSNVALWRENFLEAARRAGEYTFRPALEDSSELWSACEDLYGKGLPFRHEVSERLQSWFDSADQEHLHEQLEDRILQAWEHEVLTPLSHLSEDLDVEAGLATDKATGKRKRSHRHRAEVIVPRH